MRNSFQSTWYAKSCRAGDSLEFKKALHSGNLLIDGHFSVSA